jgi:hypothetical protein
MGAELAAEALETEFTPDFLLSIPARKDAGKPVLTNSDEHFLNGIVVADAPRPIL